MSFGKKQERDTLIKPEIRVLAKRGQVTLAEYKKLYMNSYERNFLLPFCTNEVLLQQAQLYMENSFVTQYPSSYDEVIVSLLFPLVCQRLQEKEKT